MAYPFKMMGKGLSFVSKGIGKGFKAVKKAVFGVGAAMTATASFLGLGRKTEAEGKDAQRGIEEAASEGDRKIEGVKAETNKMTAAPPPRPDPEVEADKRAAKAEAEASKQKLDAMEADLRVMDNLSAHTAEILRRYGSHAAKDMVAGMDTRKPTITPGMSTNVLMGEQIRLMYEQKTNHRHGIYNVLSMIGANNELLGVLSDQLRLIYAQGVTDATYDVIKAKVMDNLATKALADSVKANAESAKYDATVRDALEELVALQKEGNASQEAGTRPLLKKVGLGMVAGLAGLAGLMLASKYLGSGDEDSNTDDKESSDGDEKEWKWPWEDDEPEERDDEEDKKNSDYIKDDGTLMSVEERNRVDELKNEAKLTGGAAATAHAIEGISAIKSGKAAVTAGKAAVEATAKVGAKTAIAEARKKFLKSLTPKALKAVGVKLAAKLGIKALAKAGARKIPILGSLVGLGEAAYRAFKGDYTGAALAFGSGAASLLHAADVVTGPGGSIAAISLGLAADGALAMHDYNKAMEELKSTGHTDMLEDDELNDILVPPTEQEIKDAEEAEKKVNDEGTEKADISSLSQDGVHTGAEESMTPKEDPGKGVAPPPQKKPGKEEGGLWDKFKDALSYGEMLFSPGSYLAKKGLEEAQSSQGGLWAKVKGFASGLGKGLLGPMFSSSAPSSTPGSHEVSHGGTGIWMGYGAEGNDDGEGMGDLSECRSYPPEVMERITNFEGYPPNEIDENGQYKADVQGMIDDLIGMQGTIKYSMEQRDIDKGIGDCSTFTKWAMKKYFGIDIGNNCDMQLGENLGKVVDYSGVGINGETAGARGPNISALKPGDLIYYSSSRRPWNAGRPFRIAHVEMYIGNGQVIGQTTTKGKGKGSDPNGPWVHDINDPNLGTFLAAKRYIGQTEGTAKYAVDPKAVTAQQSSVSTSQGTSTATGSRGGGKASGVSYTASKTETTKTVHGYTASGNSVSAPTHTPNSQSSSSSGSQTGQGSQAAPGSQTSAPVSIDNSSVTNGGNTYITNNNTTNFYTHEDGRGSSEVN